MKDKKIKKISGLVVKIFVVLLFVVVFMAAGKYSSQGTIDDQIYREKDRNRILRQRTIKGKILESKEQLDRFEEIQRETMIKLQEQDSLNSEVQQLLEDKNLDYFEAMEEWRKNRHLYVKEDEETSKTEKGNESKDEDSLINPPVRTEHKVRPDKAEQLANLKRENRELSIAVFEEAILFNVKRKREKELKNVDNDLNSYRDRRINIGVTIEDKIYQLKNEVEILKLMPAKEKGENSYGKGRKKTEEMTE